MRVAAALFMILGVSMTHAMAGEGVSVRGQIVDPAGLALSNATIRVMAHKNRSTRYRSQSGSDGRFLLESIRSGTYTVAISVPGFREKLIEKVPVTRGRDVDLERIRLDFAGCDAPGGFCNSVSPEPLAGTRFSQGEIKVPLGCAADIDKGEVICTVELDGPPVDSPMRDSTTDFWLQVRSDGRVYLKPRNGARLAEPNSAAADCGGAVFLGRPVRIDGLGPGSDLCLRSNDGRYSHIFLMQEVRPASEQIVAYYVTWK